MVGLAASQTRLLAILNKYADYADTDIEDPYRYDVVISFAGEDRKYAKVIADYLIERDIDLFYDEYSQPQLWGKNLYDHQFASIGSGIGNEIDGSRSPFRRRNQLRFAFWERT